MKIAVTGEGPTDYGKEEYGTGKWLWGPIEVYLRRVAEQEGVSIELVPFSEKMWKITECSQERCAE